MMIMDQDHDHGNDDAGEMIKDGDQVMLPSGGLLLMSLAPYTDTDTGYRVTR